MRVTPSPSPLPKGLPNTPVERLQAFALAIVVQALWDGTVADDADAAATDRLVVGEDQPWFDALLRIIGIGDPETRLLVKLMYCHGCVDLDRLRAKTLHAGRFSDDDPRTAAADSVWQAWPKAAPLSRSPV
ncbi:hypothetical protein QTI17_17285 [Variovorax sp. J31P179]|uniref:hypothetical protein n=1 Tax=Variovorax sp. J31P179 TaxID=3053508 RepID=UPI002574C9D9|nr:hypothetical protein [Variovorax sp. J31P179]MDM0082349.1 hypothetical protein [Variovorax sp. J31P179]